MVEFFDDVVKHFEQEAIKPNSIRRRNFNDYQEVVKNTISSLTISDAEFNKIYADLHAF
jgi:hypothetical protein